MPRYLAPLALLLAAQCAPAAEDSSAQVWTSGRDGLCLAGPADQRRAGLITYGAGKANCSLSGPARQQGATLTITPTGDAACTVAITIQGDRALIGDRAAACAYYCGPGADFAGRTLGRSDRPVRSVTDFAGESLC